MNTTVPPAPYPTYEVVEVTPELAKEWLRHNSHNRNLRERVVNGYAADMLSGDWVEDGQSIKFSASGILLDGQHRLSAIVQSRVTQRMLIVRGLPDSSQDTMDVGAKRVLADVLRLRGEQYNTTLAAILLRVYQWDQGYRRSFKAGARPTHRQLLAVLDKHPEVRRSAEIADRIRKPARISGSTAGLCHWLFNQIDCGDCAFFFARLGDGTALVDGDPVYALRRVLSNFAADKGRPDETHVTALVIKAWNAYREGRPVQLLAYKGGGSAPEAYPEPK